MLLTLAFGAAGARADADPASDYLIQLDAFYPFSTKVSTEQKQALNAALASGRKAGVPIKAAVIAAPNDLGAVTVLFRQAAAVCEVPRHGIELRHESPGARRDAERLRHLAWRKAGPGA